jgi:hypothetical protein
MKFIFLFHIYTYNTSELNTERRRRRWKQQC